MATEGAPQPDLKPALELLTAKLDSLSARVESVSIKVDAAAVKASLPTEQTKPWWTTLTAILGIPALIFVMYLQFSQGGEAKANTQKSIAETEKARTEELKARTELQTELETLAEKKSQGIASYQKQLNESLPKLEQAIERLNAANLAKQQINRDLLVQFVVLWIFMLGIGLSFDLITAVWDSSISIPLGVFYSLRWSDSKLADRIRRIVSVTVPVLSPVPRILRVAVQISIFFALFAPLFDQVSATTGSGIKFDLVAHSVRTLRLGDAVGQIRRVLFP